MAKSSTSSNLSSDILKELSMGLFSIEIDEGKEPRLYGNKNILDIFCLDEKAAPEENFRRWHNAIDDKDLKKIDDAIALLQSNNNPEIQYYWKHPEKDRILIKSYAYINESYKNGRKIEGLIHDVSDVKLSQKKDMEIIEILASEYSSVYYIDLNTDELTPYAMNAETQSEFGQIFNSGITYSEAFKLYVDRLIFSEDKEMMLKEGSISSIKKHLARQKTYITQYRSSDNRYSEMKFVKVNAENEMPTAVALGFADKDDEIREKQQSEKEKERNTQIIEILASEYSSVYYIDLNTDELNPYAMNAETESEFGQIFNSGITYSEAFKLYVNRLIHPEDKEMMLKEGSIANITKLLEHQKTFITQYRSSNNRYSEMKFVKVNAENEKPTAVALGFADKDDEIRTRQKQEQEHQRNFDIIEILASEYSSVYYINLETDDLDPYTMNEDTESEFGQIFRSGIRYSDAYRMYVNTLIYPEDKSMMLKAGSIGNIMKELKSKKTFITTYRSADGHYCEMKFVKVGNNEGLPKAVALGFADKDTELRTKEEESKILKRNVDIIEILASEYTSVYYIDLTTDELDPYTMNAETENEFGSIFRSGIKYSDAFRMYVSTLVYPDDREKMLKAGSLYNIIKELNSKKTFITTYRSDNKGSPHYCEMKFVKVGEDESPQAVALGFADKNDELRREIFAKNEKEKNFEIIEILASEYTSVYYIDLKTDKLTPYTMNDRTRLFLEDAFHKEMSYSDAFRTYVAQAVADESKKEMLHAGSIENIKKVLKGQKTFITTYLNDQNQYSEMKFVKVGNDDTEPEAVALGFSIIDEAYRKDMENKQREEFINGLADDYEAVFHVDADKKTIETIRISEAYLNRNPSLESRMDYFKYVEAVAANIAIDDRQGFIEALSVENINREFEKENAFFHNYKILKNGVVTYYQLKVIHTGNWDNDHNFLIGVHNMDELTKAQVAQEEILREARVEAESASRAKSSFLFNMSHDIRTPMNAIIGFNNMALKHINEPEKLQSYLEKLSISSQHLLGLINDVLDMARIESGKIIIEEGPIMLGNAVRRLKEIVSQSAKGKNLTFTTNISNIRHNCIIADELRVNRVLMNIISNSIKYTPEGGNIDFTITERNCVIKDHASYDFIVKDTGIGMSKEYLGHIFEAFTRENNSTVSGIQGTGLGMAITKELVDLMHGSISIDSEQGKGTTVKIHFTFKIASEKDVATAQEIEEINEELFKGKKILLVEDNALNREIARETLNEYGMIVDEATNGEEALKICKEIIAKGPEYYHDIILMDVQMPIKDGYQTAMEIRKFDVERTRRAPIIAMTANAFAEDKKKALDCGMDAHVAKPFDVKQLLKTMSMFLK